MDASELEPSLAPNEAMGCQSGDQDSASGEQPACRVCWSEGDKDEGGSLMAPCRCIGTTKWIHERCLNEWQKTLRQQGLHRRAEMCEVCKAPYRAPEFLEPVTRGWRWRRRILSLYRNLKAQLLDVEGWAMFAFRVWSCYTVGAGVYHGVRVGMMFLAVGMKLGKQIVTEYTSIMLQLLASLTSFMGTPLAELLWTQAAAAAMLGMASQFLCTVAVTLVSGATLGFVFGYVSALFSSLELLQHLGLRGAGVVRSAAGRAAQLAVGCVKLPVLIPGLFRFLRKLVLKGL